jgi:hypothetical protein
MPRITALDNLLQANCGEIKAELEKNGSFGHIFMPNCRPMFASG